MATKKIEIQDSNGNVYYPHTDASVVKNGSKTVAEQLNDLENNKIDKSKILNNCSATEPGFVADARQLKYLKDYIDSLNVGTINNPRRVSDNTDGRIILEKGWNICKTNVESPGNGEYYVLVLNPYKGETYPNGTLIRQIWFNLWDNKTYSRQCNVNNDWTWTAYVEL